MNVKSAGFKEGGRRAARKIREWLDGKAKELYDHELTYRANQHMKAHRSTQITKELVLWADVILYMDGGNLRRFHEFCEDQNIHHKAHIICLGDYCEPRRNRIEDPAFMAKGTDKLSDTLQYIFAAALKIVGEKENQQ